MTNLSSKLMEFYQKETVWNSLNILMQTFSFTIAKMIKTFKQSQHCVDVLHSSSEASFSGVNHKIIKMSHEIQANHLKLS